MFCGACGNRLNTGTPFCIYCGAATAIPPAIPSQLPSANSGPIARTLQPPKKARYRSLKVGLGILAAFVLVMIFIGMFTPDTPANNGQGSSPPPAASSTTPTTTPKPSPTTTTTPVTPSASASAANAPDLNNADALDNAYELEADTSCGSGADDYLRSAAKYDFKWDHIGWLDTKFDKYLKVVEKPGVLVLVSDRAELQNGFGAYQRVELWCSYDTQAKKVLSYAIHSDGDN